MRKRKSIASFFKQATLTGLLFSYLYMREGCSEFCMKWFAFHNCIVLFVGIYSLITVILNHKKYSLFELWISIITIVIAIISLFMIMMAKPV